MIIDSYRISLFIYLWASFNVIGCSDDTNSELKEEIASDVVVIQSERQKIFNEIATASSLETLSPYLFGNDISLVRAAFDRLGNLVPQDIISRRELENAWHMTGVYAKPENKDVLTNDIVRVKLAYHIVRNGNQDNKYIDYLYSLMSSNEPSVQYDLVLAFAEIGNGRAIDYLVKTVRGTDPNLAIPAISSLGYRSRMMNDDRAREALQSLANDSEIKNPDLLKAIQEQL